MSKPTSSTQMQDLSTTLVSLIASTAPSVVSVHSNRSRSTGFAWRPGLIVTADEALSEEGELAVTLGDGETVAAQLVGRDPTTDVAVLRVDRSDLRPIRLATSVVAPGALVTVVGAAGGHAHRSVWRGVARRRTLAVASWWRDRCEDRT